MYPQTTVFVTGLIIGIAVLGATTAQARDVMVVDGPRTTQTRDPFAPTGADADLGREPRPRRSAGPPAEVSARPRGHRAVLVALRRSRRQNEISRARYRSYTRILSLARERHRRLRGARRAELGSVISTLEEIARSKQLKPARMPALFLILRRNAEFWLRSPFPANRGLVSFRGSRLLFEYYAGEGLQLQPLTNFKKANLMHGACVKNTGPCEPAGLRRLLRELVATSTRRGGFRTWEYYFEFGGGRPPWISGMAQATAIQAFGRSAQLLREPAWRRYARQALGAFERPPPTGVATTGPAGGVHYLQYSFAPRLFIFNAFLQSVIGLYDYSQLTGDRTARALYARAEREARREVPLSDTGDWSRYSFAGAESSAEYHELLREFLVSLCSRLRRDVYCGAARRYKLYTTEPAELELLGPGTATRGQTAQVRFSLSKLSAVQLTIRRRGKVVFDRVATFRRGTGSFAFKPRATGIFGVRLAAKELRTGRELRTYEKGEIEALGAG
ncbi:MAG: D-glucuronyl C5-epimerase family protein [Actinomycetota bacterium]|nr:D-glucuronyl C5-epimerase family protein [Actinomycetota bacterium]